MRLTRFTEFSKKIVCVGRNYAEHSKEMGASLPSKPLLFLKPSTAFLSDGGRIRTPKGCDELHHEVELGIVISRKGSCISECEANDYIGGYVIALDMTARNLQADAKKKGDPWSIAKGFDTSCPVGAFIPKESESMANVDNLNIWCKVNEQLRQNGNTGDMIFKIPTIISYISQYFTLESGDLILTGTPANVGPVKSGDHIQIGIGHFSKASFTVE